MGIIDRVEDVALRVERWVQTAWLRVRFATGNWRGVMIHADRRGRLGRFIRVEGLNVAWGDPLYKVTRDDEVLIAIGGSDGRDGS